MSDNEQDRPEADGVNRAPPYISFATLLTFLKGLKADGVPPQIDKSVLSKLSGGVQGQMKLALRSLGLMDGDVPTPNLVRIVEAYDKTFRRWYESETRRLLIEAGRTASLYQTASPAAASRSSFRAASPG